MKSPIKRKHSELEKDYFISEFHKLNSQEQQKTVLDLVNTLQPETLSMLSCTILPRLKRDFIDLLPCELGFKILNDLDLLTLVRCSRVCKSWNAIINGRDGNLRLWKQRLNADKFEVPSSIPNENHLAKFSMGNQDYRMEYQKQFVTRKNWLNGNHKQISFPAHGSNVVTCLSFDDEKIVTGSDDQTIHIYDIETGDLKQKMIGHEGGVWALQYYQNVLVSGSTDRTVRVWNMDTGLCTQLFNGHTSTVRCLQIILPHKLKDGTIFPERPLIVTGSRDTTIRVWSLPSEMDDEYHSEPGTNNPYFLALLTGHTNSVRAISGEGKILVSGSYDHSVKVWDLELQECIHTFRTHAEKVYSVGYCDELRRACSGSLDATVKIWCVDTGTLLYNLEGHNSLVGLLELTPNYLISAAADATLRVWCPKTGKCLACLQGHSNAITCFHYDIASNRIVSGSDGGVKAWELSTGGYGSTKVTELNSVIPKTCPLSGKLSFCQGEDGVEPLYGRFIRDIVPDVPGVWRTRLDSKRLVCAVQTQSLKTMIQVFNFATEDIGKTVYGAGDDDSSDLNMIRDH